MGQGAALVTGMRKDTGGFEGASPGKGGSWPGCSGGAAAGAVRGADRRPRSCPWC